MSGPAGASRRHEKGLRLVVLSLFPSLHSHTYTYTRLHPLLPLPLLSTHLHNLNDANPRSDPPALSNRRLTLPCPPSHLSISLPRQVALVVAPVLPRQPNRQLVHQYAEDNPLPRTPSSTKPLSDPRTRSRRLRVRCPSAQPAHRSSQSPPRLPQPAPSPAVLPLAPPSSSAASLW